ncbi:MAG TPA: RDD family protein [Terriglobia bacterium]|nr:RDD family protein [Terriglobia bacterium]
MEPELARIPRNVPGNLGEMPRSQPAPIEFMDAAFTSSGHFEDADQAETSAAPIGKRFLAGLIDAVVLILAACLFIVLFSLAGGNLQSTPVDLVIAAWMITFWIFAYFASFSAVALSTPGQAAMGLVVRNLEGELPTRQESFLRAFGYLVSIGSLMLGFLWAAMDSDGLAWHDHISGTYLTED